MEPITNATPIVYDPNVPLHKQVIKVEELGGIFKLPGVPYTHKDVIFSPLNINGTVYDITLNKRSAVGQSRGKVCVYDKLTFEIKDQSGKIIHDKIKPSNIDKIVQDLYHNQVSNNLTNYKSI